MLSLQASRVLITGAGSGLGRATAMAFAAKGARIAVSDVQADSARETAERVQAQGMASLPLSLDVSSEESFASAVEQVQREWGGIDVLVNNAGVATAGTVAESPIRQWQWVLDINLLGCVRGARAVIPLMQGHKSGHIVNVASFAGIANPPALASYNAAKAAVISLSETLRFELFPDIAVSVVCPSFFRTGLLDSGRGQIGEAEQASAPQMMKIMRRLMDKAEVSAEDVAADIVNAVMTRRFMVMTHADARSHARLKRLSPEMYFRSAQKSTAAFLKKP